MTKFTKEEISLCKQVAERHRKEIKRGDWIIDDEGKICLIEDIVKNNITVGYGKSFKMLYYDEGISLHPKITSLWTISDCLEFLRERCKDHVLLIHEENLDDGEEWYLWFDEFHETQQWGKGKTPLEASLKVVLAVLEEER